MFYKFVLDTSSTPDDVRVMLVQVDAAGDVLQAVFCASPTSFRVISLCSLPSSLSFISPSIYVGVGDAGVFIRPDQVFGYQSGWTCQQAYTALLDDLRNSYVPFLLVHYRQLGYTKPARHVASLLPYQWLSKVFPNFLDDEAGGGQVWCFRVDQTARAGGDGTISHPFNDIHLAMREVSSLSALQDAKVVCFEVVSHYVEGARPSHLQNTYHVVPDGFPLVVVTALDRQQVFRARGFEFGFLPGDGVGGVLVTGFGILGNSSFAGNPWTVSHSPYVPFFTRRVPSVDGDNRFFLGLDSRRLLLLGNRIVGENLSPAVGAFSLRCHSSEDLSVISPPYYGSIAGKTLHFDLTHAYYPLYLSIDGAGVFKFDGCQTRYWQSPSSKFPILEELSVVGLCPDMVSKCDIYGVEITRLNLYNIPYTIARSMFREELLLGGCLDYSSSVGTLENVVAVAGCEVALWNSVVLGANNVGI